MRIFLIILIPSLHFLFAENIDQNKLKIIENFLSTMTTLESAMHMEIINNNSSENYKGKIWLDRKNKLMRINYGKSFMVAKDGVLTICQENAEPQTLPADSTPAGILLEPSIQFSSGETTVNSLQEVNGVWALNILYNSPVGLIPVTLYFKQKPVMLLLGWTIQNTNGSVINVHLDPEKTHMSIGIDNNIFEVTSLIEDDNPFQMEIDKVIPQNSSSTNKG